MRANESFTPVVLTRHLQNEELFPVTRIYSLDRVSGAARFFNQASYRLRGYYSLFAAAAPDAKLIHAHFGHIGYKALGLARKLRVPLITTFYGYDVSALGRQASYRRRFARLFQEGQLFLAEGPCLARSLEELGCPREKIRIFHLGVDILPDRQGSAASLMPTGFSIEQIRVLFAATFTDKKGWPDALAAFAQAAREMPNLRLRLIGGGEDEARVTAVIRDLKIESRIDRSGYVNHGELLREMRASDIFLQPSRVAANGNTEGGAPVTLIDAQSVGLPICATMHADIPEVAPHDVSALLAPERDINAIAHNILRLATDRQLRQRLGAGGRAHVAAEYNWAIQGPRLAEIYKSVL